MNSSGGDGPMKASMRQCSSMNGAPYHLGHLYAVLVFKMFFHTNIFSMRKKIVLTLRLVCSDLTC